MSSGIEALTTGWYSNRSDPASCVRVPSLRDAAEPRNAMTY